MSRLLAAVECGRAVCLIHDRPLFFIFSFLIFLLLSFFLSSFFVKLTIIPLSDSVYTNRITPMMNTLHIWGSFEREKGKKKKRTLAFVKVNSTSGCTELMEPEKYRSHFGHQKDMPFLLALNRILFIFQDGRVYYRRGLMSLQRRRPRPPKKRTKRRIET